MNFILDCSLAMAFVLADEATPDTDRILDTLGHGAKALTPALWRWEVGNVLLMAEKRKRITAAETGRHLIALQQLPIEQDEDAWREAWSAVPLLARKHRLTLYDAAYLELAIRRGAPLGSLDDDLRKAAQAEAVALIPETI